MEVQRIRLQREQGIQGERMVERRIEAGAAGQV
jgi:hypothetical protein